MTHLFKKSVTIIFQVEAGFTPNTQAPLNEARFLLASLTVSLLTRRNVADGYDIGFIFVREF